MSVMDAIEKGRGSWIASRLPNGVARRFLLTASVVAVTGAGALALPGLAGAQVFSNPNMNIVGTSDVSDSGLMANVIIPDFKAANPQGSSPALNIQYFGSATGTAITNAETGVDTPSMLIVHAASLENQFVANGFSAGFPTSNPTASLNYGNPLFTNQFILAGTSAIPGTSNNDTNDIGQAFVDVANAGDAGDADFISRGGTPGTTVEEHAIWALIGADSTLNAELPSDMQLCPVSSANGGGLTPVLSSISCPDPSSLPTKAQQPLWYHTTGDTQGPNVQAANNCDDPSLDLVSSKCFVFTDDGTYAFLQSEGDIPALSVTTLDNSATTIGDENTLVNYFHGYIVQNTNNTPATPNLQMADAMMSFITSPAGQADIEAYLSTTTFASSVGGKIFSPTAAPTITAAASGGHVTGSVTDNQPGFPVLNGVPVTINRVTPTPLADVADGTTDSSGDYNIAFSAAPGATYDVTTDPISKIEITFPSPTPDFGDTFVAGASSAFA